MGRELPNEVCEFFIRNWDELGLNPVIVYRLLERGLSHDEIDFAMSTLIGPDWTMRKVTRWIDQLEDAGLITIPVAGDTPPVADMLADIIRSFNYRMCGYCNLGGYREEQYDCGSDEYIVPLQEEVRVH